MKKYKWWEEDVPVNATGTSVAGTGDDDSTVVVKKRIKVYKRKRKMSKEDIEEVRDYRKEYDEYHAKPEQRERNAARLRARRQMEKWGKVKKFDKMDVHHKDNNPLNNEKDNLAVTTQNWNRSEPRLRKEELDEAVSVKEFDSLKKGDTVTIEYKSAMSSGKATFKVTAKNVVGKARVEKVTLQSIKNPRGVKHFLYKRSTGVTFAQGDMGSQVVSFKKEEVEESINILERELTPNELKRREEIAQDLNDADFKKRYGDRWKEVKMGVATKMAKGESVEEADMKKDPKADKEKGKLLKVKKAIAQAQLDVAKEQERIQKLTDLQTKITQKASQGKKEETIMSKKYLETKTGSLEEVTLGIWTDAAEELDKLNVTQEGFSSSLVKKAVKIATQMGGNMTGAVEKIEKLKRGLSDDKTVADALRAANEEVVPTKVDGRTKSYKETLRRIKMRQEKKAKSLEQQKVEEASGGKEEYQKFVNTMLKKFGVSSPAELEGDKKKQFYDALDAGWEGDNEKPEKGDKKKEVKEATKYKFPTLSASKDDVADAKKIAAKLKRVYKDVKMKHTSSGAAGGGPGWEISFTDKEDNPEKVLKALQKTGYDDGDMDTDDLEPFAEGNVSIKPGKKGDKSRIKRYGKDEPKNISIKKKVNDDRIIEFSEKIEFVEYKFRNKTEAQAAKKFFDGQQRMEFEVNDDNISNGELAVDAGKNDMTKYHEAIVKKLKPKVVTKENEKKK